MNIINITTTHLHHDDGSRFYIVYCCQPDASLYVMGSGEVTKSGLRENFVSSSWKKEEVLHLINKREREMEECGYRQMSCSHEDLDLDTAKDIDHFISHYEKLLGLRRAKQVFECLTMRSTASPGYAIKTSYQEAW